MNTRTVVRGLSGLLVAAGLGMAGLALAPAVSPQPTLAEIAVDHPQVSLTEPTEAPATFAPSSPVSRAQPAKPSPTVLEPSSPTPAPTPAPAPTPTPTPAPAPAQDQPAAPPAPAGPQVITLSPVTALRDQGVIDQGHLVTWMTNPTCLLAGHDVDGWHWMSSVPVGTIIEVATGPCVGRYEITGHNGHDWRGGPVPDWMADNDLILQTCTPNGTGFSLARRV